MVWIRVCTEGPRPSLRSSLLTASGPLRPPRRATADWLVPRSIQAPMWSRIFVQFIGENAMHESITRSDCVPYRAIYLDFLRMLDGLARGHSTFGPAMYKYY